VVSNGKGASAPFFLASAKVGIGAAKQITAQRRRAKYPRHIIAIARDEFSRSHQTHGRRRYRVLFWYST
jgi:hypothetical protein